MACKCRQCPHGWAQCRYKRAAQCSQRLASAVETTRGSPITLRPGSSMSLARTILKLQPSRWYPGVRQYPASSPNAAEIGQLNDPLGIDVRSSRPQCLSFDASQMHLCVTDMHNKWHGDRTDQWASMPMSCKTVNAPAPRALTPRELAQYRGDQTARWPLRRYHLKGPMASEQFEASQKPAALTNEGPRRHTTRSAKRPNIPKPQAPAFKWQCALNMDIRGLGKRIRTDCIHSFISRAGRNGIFQPRQ
ncbi:hypothetical protein EV121DRAFT_273762 [Schizophyllum commune]